MNIEDIKERVNDNKTSLDCDLDDLSDCVEWLLEKNEKYMSLFHQIYDYLNSNASKESDLYLTHLQLNNMIVKFINEEEPTEKGD